MLGLHTHRSSRNYFDKIPHPARLQKVWFNGDEVTAEDVNEIADRYGLDSNIIRDIFDKNELPRVEYDELRTIYMFLRVAWRTKRGEVKTAVFLTIAGHKDFLSFLQTKLHCPDGLRQRDSSMDEADTILPLLYTLAAVVAEYEQLIHDTAETVRVIKRRLRQYEATNEDFLHFITIEENIAIFLYNLTALFSVAERLHEDKYRKLSARHIEALEDIMLHIKQLSASVDSTERTVSSLQTVYSTISNNTLNQRMKLLTIVTLLVTVPNVFYGMYGMNIALPFAHEPWMYEAIMGVTIVIMLLIILLAKKFRLL